MNLESKIYIAGHAGLAGSAIWRALLRSGYTNVVGRRSTELDLRIKKDVDNFFNDVRPHYVVLAAGVVGGIKANFEQPVRFLQDNLTIQSNVIDAAYQSRVKKLIFLGSSCIYPKHSSQPIKEEYLMTGKLEPTNEWYAIAKIAGIELCQAYRQQYGSDFICAMPTNLYGPNDNYDINRSHVLAGMIRRFHDAKTNGLKSVKCWGTGSPLREFMHSDDLGRAVIHLLNHYSDQKIINIGTGIEVSIRQLSEMIAQVVGYRGEILWDHKLPDGTPRKLLDCSRIREQGWRHEIDLIQGVTETYKDYCEKLDIHNDLRLDLVK